MQTLRSEKDHYEAQHRHLLTAIAEKDSMLAKLQDLHKDNEKNEVTLKAAQ